MANSVISPFRLLQAKVNRLIKAAASEVFETPKYALIGQLSELGDHVTNVERVFSALPDEVKQRFVEEEESSPSTQAKRTKGGGHPATKSEISVFVNALLDEGHSTDAKELAKKVKDHFGLSRVSKSLNRTIGAIKSRRTLRLNGSAQTSVPSETGKTTKRRKSIRKPAKKTAPKPKATKKNGRKESPEAKQAVREVFSEHGLTTPTERVKELLKDKGYPNISGRVIHGIRMDETKKTQSEVTEV